MRRIAWIEYYVSKGELDKARELGWSGDMSFLGLNDDGTPMAEAAEEAAEEPAEEPLLDTPEAMHRI